MAKPAMKLPLRPHEVIRWLVISTVLMLCVHSLLTIVHYKFFELPWLLRELFDVDEEESIPTWFSSALLLLTSLVLFVTASLARQSKDSHAAYWFGLGLGFGFMSADEIAGFHETLNTVTEFSWALPGLLVATIVGVAYLRFLSSLPSATAIRFIMSGAVFVGGAVGVELATEPYLYDDALDTMAYNLWTPVEEGMEIGGVIMFLSALFDYLASRFKMELQFVPRR